MNSPVFFVLAIAFYFTAAGRADPPIPSGILDPKTAAEAWNVIHLATNNVELLISEKRLSEVPVQISYCSPALRSLARYADSEETLGKIQEKTTRAFISINAIARGAQDHNPPGITAALASLRKILDQIALFFDPSEVNADIFVCPMHPDFIAGKADAHCAKCGMSLLKRRIPYSSIYTKPGEPTVHMTATASAPVEAGKTIDVKVRLEKADQSPVLPTDLLVMHTQPIHLLIEDPSLDDYHHEHPKPTATPGEYEFSFTPKKTAPYRIWADLVPVATGLQELPRVDLPSPGQGEPVADMENRFTASAGGYEFALALAGGNHVPVKAGQVRKMDISITTTDGQPVKKLEPVMSAFAHLVGFYDDFQTVVHLHPMGGEITNLDERGGPLLGFTFFPPKAGFILMYCQVLVDGKMLFAPFNLRVLPDAP